MTEARVEALLAERDAEKRERLKAEDAARTATLLWEGATEACAELRVRVAVLEAALRDYDSTVEQAVAELGERGDKDFFWKERVADAVQVMKALRKSHRAVLAGGDAAAEEKP